MSDQPILEVVRSGLGDGWVAEYIRWACEDDCPLRACWRVIVAELETVRVAASMAGGAA